MLKYPHLAGSSNGRTPPFEGGYLGSNPSPATNHCTHSIKPKQKPPNLAMLLKSSQI
jgi:hypothetical protein